MVYLLLRRQICFYFCIDPCRRGTSRVLFWSKTRCTSVQFSCSVLSDSLRPHESQHARLPCPSSTPGVHSNSRPSSQWCHPAISSSVVPFSSCPQSLPASESFPMSQLFAWGGQSTGESALASVLPKNTQDRSPSEWTGWICLQSKERSRVFSNTTVQKHQFFHAQLSSHSPKLMKWLGIIRSNHEILVLKCRVLFWFKTVVLWCFGSSFPPRVRLAASTCLTSRLP